MIPPTPRSRALPLAAAALASSLFACGVTPPAPPAADLVLRNARVYTADPARPWAEAISIRADRILRVGSETEVLGADSSGARVVDLGGRLVLPGFIDSHNHITYGADPEVLQLFDTATPSDVYDRLRRAAADRPAGAWIEGEGWNYSIFPAGRLPGWRELEGVTGDRPVFLVSYDAHTVWLNRPAIDRLGVPAAKEALPFGEVQRDAAGRPTGILSNFATLGLSRAGQEALARILPSWSEERRYERLKRNLDSAARYGITTIVDPQVYPEDLPLYRRARAEGLLKPRMQIALFHPRGTDDATLDRFAALMREYDDDRLRVAAVKLYIDDVIEPHTAALLEPYADRPDLRGDTLYPPDEFREVVTRLDRRKFQLFIHAIGDRGIRTALDALEAARTTNGPRDARHQLVHVECLSPADVPRFHALGVVACMQPRHCAPDISARWAANIGPVRSRTAWAFRSLRDAGTVLAFASDWNVAEMDPLIGIYTALTRQDLQGRPPDGWIPDQTIDLDTAVLGYTRQGAWANFLEGSRGTLAPGLYADLVVLSDDLFRIPKARVKDAHVLWTLVGGGEIYRSPDFPRP